MISLNIVLINQTLLWLRILHSFVLRMIDMFLRFTHPLWCLNSLAFLSLSKFICFPWVRFIFYHYCFFIEIIIKLNWLTERSCSGVSKLRLGFGVYWKHVLVVRVLFWWPSWFTMSWLGGFETRPLLYRIFDRSRKLRLEMRRRPLRIVEDLISFIQGLFDFGGDTLLAGSNRFFPFLAFILYLFCNFI